LDKYENLIRGLNHPNKRERTRAAAALGTVGDKSFAHYLLPLLNDPWGPAAWEAYQAIIKLKDVKTTAQAYQASESIMQINGVLALKSLSEVKPLPQYQDGEGVISHSELNAEEKEIIHETLSDALNHSNPVERIIAIEGLARILEPEELQACLRPLVRLRVNPFKYDDSAEAFIDDVGFAVPLLGLPQVTISVSELTALHLILSGDEEMSKKIFKHALEEWWYLTSPKDKMIMCMSAQKWDWVLDKLAEYAESENINDRLAAIACLKIIKDPRVVSILETFSNDDKRKVRKTAEKAIRAWHKAN